MWFIYIKFNQVESLIVVSREPVDVLFEGYGEWFGFVIKIVEQFVGVVRDK